jgi:putative tryptophan/tyrosine transport system substrate-binding protein
MVTSPGAASWRVTKAQQKGGLSPRTDGSGGSALAHEPAFGATSDQPSSARLPPAIPTEVSMRRIGLVVVLAVSLFAAPPDAGAQMSNLRTIGFLGPPPSAGGLVQAFQQSLRDLGYIEGQNVRIEYRYTDVALRGHAELFPQLAAELVQLKPDVLVVSVTEAALAAKNATSTIPIVMVSVPDPVAAGLVASLARPGGNVTGLSRQTRDIISKTLQLLKESLPETTRVNLLSDPKDPLTPRMVGAACALRD